QVVDTVTVEVAAERHVANTAAAPRRSGRAGRRRSAERRRPRPGARRRAPDRQVGSIVTIEVRSGRGGYGTITNHRRHFNGWRTDDAVGGVRLDRDVVR